MFAVAYMSDLVTWIWLQETIEITDLSLCQLKNYSWVHIFSTVCLRSVVIVLHSYTVILNTKHLMVLMADSGLK